VVTGAISKADIDLLVEFVMGPLGAERVQVEAAGTAPSAQQGKFDQILIQIRLDGTVSRVP
jgi:hypothetical protein